MNIKDRPSIFFRKVGINGTNKKSRAASKVLQLMDNDYSYQMAVRKVLNEDKRLSKFNLEKELDKYI